MEGDDANQVEDVSGDEQNIKISSRSPSPSPETHGDLRNVFENDVSESDEHSQNGAMTESLETKADAEEVDHFASKPDEHAPLYQDAPTLTRTIGDEVVFVKLPNFVGICPKPFDPETYVEEDDKEYFHDDVGRTRIRLKAESVMRWRSTKDEDGNEQIRSNSHMVKWSDGSQSIVLGDDVLDTLEKDITNEHVYLFLDLVDQHEHNYLMGQQMFKQRLIIQPPAITSKSQILTAKKLSSAVPKKERMGLHGKEAVLHDPRKLQKQLLDEELANERKANIEESKRRKLKELGQTRAITSAFLEDNDEEPTINQLKVQAKIKQTGSAKRQSRLTSDDEDDDEGSMDDFIDRDEQEEEEEGSDENGAEETEGPAIRGKRVIDDDDEEEGDKVDDSKGKRKRVIDMDDDDE